MSTIAMNGCRTVARGLVLGVRGLVFAVAVLFIGLVATIGIAWLIRAPAAIPGVFRARWSEHAVLFHPSGMGMLLGILVVAAGYVTVSVISSRRCPVPRSN